MDLMVMLFWLDLALENLLLIHGDKDKCTLTSLERDTSLKVELVELKNQAIFLIAMETISQDPSLNMKTTTSPISFQLSHTALEEMERLTILLLFNLLLPKVLVQRSFTSQLDTI